ncbi:hypothetical protein BE22_0062 [Staphylococcus phage vB_SepS_BE22]|nr:hypothetical protein BE22_0062 [Staphylococcus phage vB_SepS_BE22]
MYSYIYSNVYSNVHIWLCICIVGCVFVVWCYGVSVCSMYRMDSMNSSIYHSAYMYMYICM